MLVSKFQRSLFAEESQPQLSLLALWLWEQRPDIRALLCCWVAKCRHLRSWIQMDFSVEKQQVTSMSVAPLQSSLCAEESQHHLSLLALRLWKERPNIRALLTRLLESRVQFRVRCRFRSRFRVRVRVGLGLGLGLSLAIGLGLGVSVWVSFRVKFWVRFRVRFRFRG